MEASNPLEIKKNRTWLMSFSCCVISLHKQSGLSTEPWYNDDFA